MINQKFTRWFNSQKRKNKLSIKIINLNQIKNWNYSDDCIQHKSKKFFKIIGIKVISNFYKKNWDQPIILQNEIGVLGIIKNKKINKYLLQAKVEPGNINKLQLAPTVQATESNYKGVHGGLKVPYISNFLKIKNRHKFYQCEQGFRYYNKHNSNILIIKNKNIKKTPNHYWFSKIEIASLLKKKNLVNMDVISIISSSLLKKKKDKPLNKTSAINKSLVNFDKKYFIKTKIVKLSNLEDWKLTKKNIKNKKLKHFSIIGLDIKTSEREINKWQQPIIKGKRMAFAGLIKTKINETDHYLFKYLLKPGLKKSVFGCTVNSSDISTFKKKKLINLEKYFFSKKEKKKIIYENILSDEGGRFYHCQIKFCICEINFKEIDSLPENYFWLSYNQIIKMISRKKLDIESRMLFACDNIKQLK
jgi:oxidase EvaA